MLTLKDAHNIFIDFDIIKASNIHTLKGELVRLIDAGKFIYLWSKSVHPALIKQWCSEKELLDYIWGYEAKDSFVYSKVDFVIDPDQKVIDRFNHAGIPGNVLGEIK